MKVWWVEFFPTYEVQNDATFCAVILVTPPYACSLGESPSGASPTFVANFRIVNFLLEKNVTKKGKSALTRSFARQRTSPRIRLMRTLADFIINEPENVSLPRIPVQIAREMELAGGPFEWLRVQPDYIMIFQDRHRHWKKITAKPPKTEVKPKNKKSHKPKMERRVKVVGNRAVTKPINEGSVEGIIEKMDSTKDEPLDLKFIDWSST